MSKTATIVGLTLAVGGALVLFVQSTRGFTMGQLSGEDKHVKRVSAAGFALIALGSVLQIVGAATGD